MRSKAGVDLEKSRTADHALVDGGDVDDDAIISVPKLAVAERAVELGRGRGGRRGQRWEGDRGGSAMRG